MSRRDPRLQCRPGPQAAPTPPLPTASALPSPFPTLAPPKPKQPPLPPIPASHSSASVSALGHGMIQIQVTGLDDNWTNYLAAEVENLKASLGSAEQHSLTFRKDPVFESRTTHLVVGRLRRTEKLLCAIASGKSNIILAERLLAGGIRCEH